MSGCAADVEQRAFRTLSASINFIDAERQWSKATIGYDVHVIGMCRESA